MRLFTPASRSWNYTFLMLKSISSLKIIKVQMAIVVNYTVTKTISHIKYPPSQLHMHISATWWLHVCYLCSSSILCMLTAACFECLAVACLSNLHIYSAKTKHINIAMYITMLNSQRVVMTEIYKNPFYNIDRKTKKNIYFYFYY